MSEIDTEEAFETPPNPKDCKTGRVVKAIALTLLSEGNDIELN